MFPTILKCPNLDARSIFLKRHEEPMLNEFPVFRCVDETIDVNEPMAPQEICQFVLEPR
jgi:hypothetical protein